MENVAENTMLNTDRRIIKLSLFLSSEQEQTYLGCFKTVQILQRMC